MKHIILFVITSLFLVLGSCNKDPDNPQTAKGKINLNFEHQIDGEPIQFDKMIYKNAAGNNCLVNEIQYFISDITLHKFDGSKVILDGWKDIHYVDTDIPSTWKYILNDEIEPGNYEKISFTFGINELKNNSLMFVNPPESLMFWPELLGGGYHYMKLNGKWLDKNEQVSPFNFHLGIGQIYYSYPDSITGFVQNHFDIELPNSAFEMKADKTFEFKLVMHVQNWFDSPNVYDHDFWGGDIMQNQSAMKSACENGWNVFTIHQ